MEIHRVLLLLGSNLGDRTEKLASARSLLLPSVGPVVQASREYETEPWGDFAGGETPGPFLNQAIAVETALGPEAVLDAIQQIERELGRPEHRPEYAPGGKRLYHDRAIDVDILFYDSEIIDTNRLTVPHPRLAERRFALEPAAEIWPDYVHPSLKISLKELFNSILLGDSQ